MSTVAQASLKRRLMSAGSESPATSLDEQSRPRMRKDCERNARLMIYGSLALTVVALVVLALLVRG